MLFVIIRLVFLTIVFLISIFLIKRSRLVQKRRWSILAFVIAVVLTTISAWIPIENVFVTFSSPESAYRYNHSGDVKLIVEGEKTDFLVGVKGETYVYAIVPKTAGGWKIGMGFDTNRKIQHVSDGITVYVYQYKDTKESFITVLDTEGGPSDVSDNRHSEFKYLEQAKDTLGKTFYTYYAYINQGENPYILTGNGAPIDIQTEQIPYVQG